MTISQDQVKDGVEATSVATEEEGGEEFSKVEKKGGFAGCPLRREVGKFASRANPGMEVTPTSKHRRRFQNLGRRSPWGRRRRDGRMLTTREMHSIHLAFRQLVGALVRCQSPLVASHLNVWSRSLVASSSWQEGGVRAVAPTFLHSLRGEGAEIY